MKKLCTILAALWMTVSVFLPQQASAQSPEKMSYQAVIRNSSDQLVTNQPVGMQISILQGSVSGSAVYVETQTPSTNANGLVSFEIGAGTVVSGDFSTIDWENGSYFVKTETDPTGGTTYTIAGTSQLLSVPYALHAKTAESIAGGISETDPIFTAWDKSTGISITESQISDLGNYIETETDPTVPTGTQTGEMQYWDGTAWVIVSAGYEGNILTFTGGVPTWMGGTPDVTNPATGEVWKDRNLGASQVATSSTDIDSYGDLYQWGRAADGHESRTSATTTTLSSSDTPGHGDFIINGTSPFDWRIPQNDNLWQGVNGTNNPCPSGYRLPTAAEWDAERASWGSNNAAGAFGSPLKLPVAGRRTGNSGSLSGVGVDGYYWSSTVVGIESNRLYFSVVAMVNSSVRAYGASVRCIKE
ncbi:MAG: fibrobacter succinogenes major paralogous domain-containing protein [Bacteroidetes bacterium]|nr:fibrobacter succinogenes major paralogous domain-containing protein [Bacteroidota bacterium]